MLYYTGDTTHCTVPGLSFQQVTTKLEEAIAWNTGVLELDVETNVTNDLTERVLILVQLSVTCPQSGQLHIFIFQWSSLKEEDRNYLKNLLERNDLLYLIHNATFEYTVLRKYGIKLQNVYDTMLAEKLLNTGKDVEKGFYSLAGLVERYLQQRMDKSQQTEFGDNIITDEKLEYAALDTCVLVKIRNQQIVAIKREKLETVLMLENAASLAFGDIEFEGMLVDQDRWNSNIAWATPVFKQAEQELNEYCRNHPVIRRYMEKNNIIAVKDEVTINWNSPSQKKQLFSLLMPHLPGCSKPVLGKILKKNKDQEDTPGYQFIRAVHDKDEPAANKFLYENFYEELDNLGFIRKEGEVSINWASPPQRLAIFQLLLPKLKDTKAETLENHMNEELIQYYKQFNDANQLVTKFGDKWLEDHINSDGRVRTSFNQILNTGRVSSSGPNMQQIPANALPKGEQNRYRNCFIAPKDWVYVSSDYSSQELCMIAYMSQDPVWLDALSKGQDLHSVAAELVYKDKWKNAAAEGCEFYYNNAKQKCECPEHKHLRNGVKTINFGLAYGMSAVALSANLKISLREAESLIKEYFSTFPAISGLLEGYAAFGRQHGIITTIAPFYRKRYFDYWDDARRHQRNGRNFLMGKIERASKNTPIQGSCGDMTKLAMILVRNWIQDNNYQEQIKLVMVVHDQVDTICHKDVAEMWKPKLTELMEQAAKSIIKSGILKAETDVSERWQK